MSAVKLPLVYLISHDRTNDEAPEEEHYVQDSPCRAKSYPHFKKDHNSGNAVIPDKPTVPNAEPLRV